MGYGIYGTDMDDRMVEYSQKNLDWLVRNSAYEGHGSRFEVADATMYNWPHEFDVVASETYLGRAFTSPPAPEMLEKNRRDCDTILRKFLRNIHTQTKPGTRFCLAVPAWFTQENPKSQMPSAKQIPNSKLQTEPSAILRLPLLDSLEEIGYNRIDFAYATRQDLIYRRVGQIVGRELVVLTRK